MESSRRPLRQEWLTWDDVDKLVDVLLPQLRAAGMFEAVILITRGGIIPGGMLCEALNITNVLTAAVNFPRDLDHDKARLLVWPSFLQFPDDKLLTGKRILIVDDVWGSGRTSTAVKSRCQSAGATAFTCVFHFNPYRSLFNRAEPDFYAAVTDAYIVYPWELDRGLHGVTPEKPGIQPDSN
ncbi:MAG: phosphoribosyltransferase [Anaerolineae bacterium]|jgi:hypoxanthine phosphoribosyltransferase|nr:phosphoribosyltransferase [Anaerolineae bacterium]